MKLFIRGILFLFITGIISQNVFAGPTTVDNDKDLNGLPKKGLVTKIVEGTNERPILIVITDADGYVVKATKFEYNKDVVTSVLRKKGYSPDELAKTTIDVVMSTTSLIQENLTLEKLRAAANGDIKTENIKVIIWDKFKFFRDVAKIEISDIVRNGISYDWNVYLNKNGNGKIVVTSVYSEQSGEIHGSGGLRKSLYFNAEGKLVSFAMSKNYRIRDFNLDHKNKKGVDDPQQETRKFYDTDSGIFMYTVETETTFDAKNNSETIKSTLYVENMGKRIRKATLVTNNKQVKRIAVYDDITGKDELFTAKPDRNKSDDVPEDGYKEFLVVSSLKSFGNNITPSNIGVLFAVEPRNDNIVFDMELMERISAEDAIDIKKLWDAFNPYAKNFQEQKQLGQTKAEDNFKINLDKRPQIYAEEFKSIPDETHERADHFTQDIFIKVPNGNMTLDLKLTLHGTNGESDCSARLISAPFSSRNTGDEITLPSEMILRDGIGTYTFPLVGNYFIDVAFDLSKAAQIDIDKTSFTYFYENKSTSFLGLGIGKKPTKTTVITYDKNGVKIGEDVGNVNATTTIYYDSKEEIEEIAETKATKNGNVETTLMTPKREIKAYMRSTSDYPLEVLRVQDPTTGKQILFAELSSIGPDAYYYGVSAGKGVKVIVSIYKDNLSSNIQHVLEAFNVYISAAKNYVLGGSADNGIRYDFLPDDSSIKTTLFTDDGKVEAILITKNDNGNTSVNSLEFKDASGKTIFLTELKASTTDGDFYEITSNGIKLDKQVQLPRNVIKQSDSYNILKFMDVFKDQIHAARTNAGKNVGVVKNGNPVEKAKGFIQTAAEKVESKDYAGAIADYTQAKNLLSKIEGYDFLIAEVCYKIGELYYHTGDFGLATNAFKVAGVNATTALNKSTEDNDRAVIRSLLGKSEFFIGAALARTVVANTDRKEKAEVYRKANEHQRKAKEYGYNGPEWSPQNREELLRVFQNTALSESDVIDAAINKLLYEGGMTALLKSENENESKAAANLIPSLMLRLNSEKNGNGVCYRANRLQDIAKDNHKSASFFELADIDLQDKTNSRKILDLMQGVKDANKDYDGSLQEFMEALFSDRNEFYLKVFKALLEEVDSSHQENDPEATKKTFNRLIALSIMLNYFIENNPGVITTALPSDLADLKELDKLMAKVSSEVEIFGGKLFAEATKFEKIAADKGVEFSLDKSRFDAKTYSDYIKSRDRAVRP